ncbi:MAG: hypothetical protein LBI49_25655, partial [Nocardiopsaceae bacterium]|nr:hypothetical protein [Nocardiopsaceae bacterium]
MVTGGQAAQPPEGRPQPGTGQRLPPVSQLAIVALALVLAGGIDLAAHLPRPAPLAPPVAALAAAG